MKQKVSRKCCRILHLPMKKKWFDMVASGEKKEEYRLASDHWLERINAPLIYDILVGNTVVVCFRNGYSKNAPTQYRRLLRVSRRDESIHSEWGEDGYKGVDHFVLLIGEECELV